MTVRLVFLGKLADLAGGSTREMEGPLDWSGLLDSLAPELSEAAQDERTKIAVDGEVLADKTRLFAPDGAEIALLPPVSGG